MKGEPLLDKLPRLTFLGTSGALVIQSAFVTGMWDHPGGALGYLFIDDVSMAGGSILLLFAAIMWVCWVILFYNRDNHE